MIEFRLQRHSRVARAEDQLTDQVIMRSDFSDDYKHFSLKLKVFFLFANFYEKHLSCHDV